MGLSAVAVIGLEPAAPAAMEPAVPVAPQASERHDVSRKPKHLYGVAGAYVAQCRRQLREETLAKGQKYTQALWRQHATEAGRMWKELSEEEKKELREAGAPKQDKGKLRTKKHIFGAAGAYMMECRQQLREKAKAIGHKHTKDSFVQQAKLGQPFRARCTVYRGQRIV